MSHAVVVKSDGSGNKGAHEALSSAPWWNDTIVETTLFIAVQSLVARLKENLEKLTEERDQRSSSEIREKEQNKRLQRNIRDVKEEMGELAKKEAEASRKKHELVRM